MMECLSGTWFSELGSKVELLVDENGEIQGYYHPVAGGSKGHFKLMGLADVSAYDGNRSFGFVVSWNNDHINQHSVTTWSGQLHSVEGEEFLTATWLLTKETHPEDGWASTLVGTDTFRRTVPKRVSVHKQGPVP